MGLPLFGKLLRVPGLTAGWGRRAWGCGAAVAAGLLAGCGGPGAPATTAPQWSSDSTTVRLAAGPQYARSATWKFFFGTHYRSIWATPVTVPVLRLATAVPGGLQPLRAGGSYQSRTLRLRAPDGREYVLRSVDKDMSAALPPGWKRNLLRGLLRDQTSATQPYGAYPAAALAEAAGVLHANPRLVFLGPDPGLGKFKPGYANALYLLEERPDGDQRTVASFGHSPRVVNSARMLAALRCQPGAYVPARAFLRARLLDMLLGDWSRREDQWRWATFPQAGRVAFRPVPRDRDQAFFLFDDGVLTRLVSWFAPKYQTFRATIGLGNVAGLTTTARALDRTLLASLGPNDFREVADSLRASLSDAVLARAFQAGPPETRARLATKFIPMLRARREELPAVARQYYELLAKEAWVVGTDAAERFVLSGAGAGRLRLRLLAQRPGQPDSLLMERTYSQTDTQELNLYGLAGDDVLEIIPPLTQHFTVNFYGGTGENVFVPKAANGNGEMLISYATWYAAPGAALPDKASPCLRRAPDPHPELTADGQAWLHRYNLND